MITLVFVASAAVELSIGFTSVGWKYRQFLLAAAAIMVGSWMGLAAFSYGLWLLLVIALTSAYRVFNLLRIANGRAAEDRLRFAGRRTSLILISLQAAALIGFALELQLTSADLMICLVAAQLASAVVLLAVTGRNLVKTKHLAKPNRRADKELPTVTVAIPARNETADLSSCLESIIANDYPKLEVIVLDDCSHDRTAEIIKDFAQDGVRFVRGREPGGSWLAKNMAYQRLLDEATGDLILFCGVDVRFGSGAIRALVESMLNKRRSMMSVMPFRIGGGVRTAFIQPMRYWWELALPRRLFNRPPVLSTCWIIDRAVMKRLGGVAAVKRTIIPEGYFARELIKEDGYAFIRADETLNVRTTKAVEAQLATALRTRYPQLRRRPENVLLLSLLELLLLVMPFIVAGYWLVEGSGPISWLALAAAGILICVHYLIMAASNPANSLIALVNFPLVVLTEIVLGNMSMYKYEFGRVLWKGRNVCLPVMRAIPKLPPLKD